MLSIDRVEEPYLQFGDGGRALDPKEGILIHGPHTVGEEGRHPAQLTAGIVGTDTGAESLLAWLENCRSPIEGDRDHLLLHPSFPGFSSQSPFMSDVVTDNPDWRASIVATEIDRLTQLTDAAARFDYAVNLVVDKIQCIAEGHSAPRAILVVLPEEIIDHCWSLHDRGTTPEGALERHIRRQQRRAELSDATSDQGSGSSQPLESDTRRRLSYRNFRRAVKARAMRYNVPIQLIQPSMMGRSRQPPATVAWNFFVALYYKAGGFPWVLDKFDPGECFAGISFHRHVSEERSGVYSSLAQVFSNKSEGVVLRGEKFQWDEKLGRSPHLSSDDAKSLASKIVAEYQRIHYRKPTRVVIHKTSSYLPDELAGFRAGLKDVADYDLIAVAQRSTRLFREGNYPPLRGTYATIANRVHVLYTMGYIPFLGGYPRGYVPDPVAIIEHHGQASPDRTARELMALTKMNWNCADFANAMPITLLFSGRVGEIMSEIPEGDTPKSSFKFYM